MKFKTVKKIIPSSVGLFLVVTMLFSCKPKDADNGNPRQADEINKGKNTLISLDSAKKLTGAYNELKKSILSNKQKIDSNFLPSYVLTSGLALDKLLDLKKYPNLVGVKSISGLIGKNQLVQINVGYDNKGNSVYFDSAGVKMCVLSFPLCPDDCPINDSL